MNSVLEFHNHLPLLPAPPTTGHHDGASSSTSISAAKSTRKKRLKYSKQQLQNGVVSFSAAATDNNIARACSECGKKFWSWKALFGHMRCHPERHWRGINQPPNHRRPAASSPVITTATRPLNDNLDDYEIASCLLLLANNGSETITATTTNNTIIHDHEHDYHQTSYDVGESNKYNNGCITSTTFECSSCKKVFWSHQELGGHRASHKNVKGCFAMARPSSSTSGQDDHATGTCCTSKNNSFGLDFDLNLTAVRDQHSGGCCWVSSSACSSCHDPGQLAYLDLRLGF